MRALAIFLTGFAFLAATPANAFGHSGGVHVGSPHPGGGPHGHGRNGRGGSGYFDGALGQTLPEVPDQTAVAPYIAPAAAPQCLASAPVFRPQPPHIIYIGHAPTITGPKVIYGTD